jgi:hypothetical protein
MSYTKCNYKIVQTIACRLLAACMQVVRVGKYIFFKEGRERNKKIGIFLIRCGGQKKSKQFLVFKT